MDVFLCNQIIACTFISPSQIYVLPYFIFLHSVVIARLWHQFGEKCYVVIYGFHTEVLLQYCMYIVYLIHLITNHLLT